MGGKSLLFWEVLGIVLISLAGSLLHFTFEWSGKNPIAGFFSAVNESTWEHLKIGFFAALLFALLEYFIIGKDYPNFWFSKAVSFYVITMVIPLIFYSYKYILGKNYLVLDILTFILAIILAQVASYKIISSGISNDLTKALTPVLLIVIILSYSLFTYFPPHNFLFTDPRNGSYGINI